jgi:hypothetical protein
MKREGKSFAALLVSAIVLASAAVSFGQQREPERRITTRSERIIQGPPMPPPGDAFFYIASEMSFDGKLVKGAPYSAEAVTETTQTLSDGNRIVNKSTASVYRDSEGRTRREQTLKAIGPLANNGASPQTIFISDPVVGVSYVLEPNSRVARKMTPMRFEYKIAAPAPSAEGPNGPPSTEVESDKAKADEIKRRTQGPTTGQRAEIRSEGFVVEAPPPPEGAGAPVIMEWHNPEGERAKRESLGKQNIEGVEAEGTRIMVTIPAGEIGNERPIEIVSERWYSPELQTVVMTKHSDPRSGEIVYRLTNINRSEPDRTLFQVPSDFTIKEGPIAPRAEGMRMRKPTNDQ